MIFLLMIEFILFQMANAKTPSKTELDPNKFTICSITLNSTQERKIFETQVKKSPEKFNPIVELTDFKENSSEDKNWFDLACESGIQCDQVVISGHFSNTEKHFFGSSKLDLELSALEAKSCSKTCDGILSHPYEIFALGCNTLEEVNVEPMREFLKAGLTPSEAQAQIEGRGGVFGESNKSALLRAFGGERKQIYGYFASGPSGATVEQFLKKYFSSNSLVDRLEKLQADRLMGKIDSMNKDLAASLKSTNFSQCEGGGLYRDELNSLRCKIVDTNLDRKDRMSAVVEALGREDFLAFIPTINQFLSELSENNWDDETKSEFKLVSENEELKKRILTLISKVKSVDKSRDYITLAENLHFIDDEQKNEIIKQAFEKSIFKTNLSKDDLFEICYKYPELVKTLKLSELSETKLVLKNEDYEALRCLEVISESNKRVIIQQLAKKKENISSSIEGSVLSSENRQTQELILESISKSRPNTNMRIILEGALRLSTFENNDFIKKNIKNLTGFLFNSDTGLQGLAIALLGQKISDNEIQEAVLSEFEKRNDIRSPEILSRLLFSSPELTDQSYERIQALLPTDLDFSGSVLNLYLYLFKKHPNQELIDKTKQVIKINRSALTRGMLVNSLLSLELSDAEKMELLKLSEEGLNFTDKIELLRNVKSSYATDRLIELLEEDIEEDEAIMILTHLSKRELSIKQSDRVWPLLKKKLPQSSTESLVGLRFNAKSLFENMRPLSDKVQEDLISLLSSKNKKNQKIYIELLSGSSSLPPRLGLKMMSFLESKNKKYSKIAYNHLFYLKEIRAEYVPFILRALEKHKTLDFEPDNLALALSRCEKIPALYQNVLMKNLLDKELNLTTRLSLIESLEKIESLSGENQLKVFKQILEAENQNQLTEGKEFLSVLSKLEIKDSKVQIKIIEAFNPENDKIPTYAREFLKSIVKKMKITDSSIQKLSKKYFPDLD